VWLGHCDCEIKPDEGLYGFEKFNLSIIRVAVILEAASKKAYISRMAGYGKSIIEYHGWMNHKYSFCIFQKEVIILDLVCTQGGSQVKTVVSDDDVTRINHQLRCFPNLSLIMLCTAKAEKLVEKWNLKHSLIKNNGKPATFNLNSRGIKIFWMWHPNAWLRKKKGNLDHMVKAHENLTGVIKSIGLGDPSPCCGLAQFTRVGMQRFTYFEPMLSPEARANIAKYSYVGSSGERVTNFVRKEKVPSIVCEIGKVEAEAIRQIQSLKITSPVQDSNIIIRKIETTTSPNIPFDDDEGERVSKIIDGLEKTNGVKMYVIIITIT
jgi:hypothetical protein